MSNGLVLTGTAITAGVAGVINDGFGGVVFTNVDDVNGEFSLSFPGLPLTTTFSDADTGIEVDINKGIPATPADIAIESLTKTTGTVTETLSIFVPDLNYTTFFIYEANDDTMAADNFAVGVVGFETPVSDMPTTGSATYTGKTFGIVANVGAADVAGRLEGDLSLTANFGTASITGSITNTMVATVEDPGNFEFTLPLGSPTPWNNLSLAATFNNGNRFSGTVTTSNAVGGVFGLASGLSGPLEGQFFGPGAAEVGGAWSIDNLASGGDIISIGAFGGHR